MYSPSQRHARARHRGPKARRGVALVFVMVFVIAMAALAVSSIFMSSGSTVLARSYDRERDVRFAAEVALAIGKSRVNQNPGLLVLPAGTYYKQIMTNEQLYGADNQPIPGIVGNIYIGLTGSSSGQNGRFASIVAQAVDPVTHASFIRRLEMTQESFAKYAYWSNSETSNGQTIYFNNGDQFWGPVWSNDKISIGSGGATFNSDVGTASVIDGMVYGTFAVPPLQNQQPIALPSTSVLSQLSTYATAGGNNMTTAEGPSGNEALVRDRIEFIAFDTDTPADGDSTGVDEGFYRWYQGNNNTGTDSYVRGDWGGTRDSYGVPNFVPSAQNVKFCGDWHWSLQDGGPTPILAFYPASVHGTSWFKSQLTSAMNTLPLSYVAPYTSVSDYVAAEAGLTTQQILQHPKARCYLAGDPHLVAVDRPGTTRVQIGGEDTTFTAKGNYGQWIAPAVPPPSAIVTRRSWDGAYLYPLGHSLNPNGKGVIYASGNVGISGVVNGLVTLYTPGSIVILDDVRYANDPVLGVCHDILGLISGYDVVVADNALNTPVWLDLQSSDNYGFRSMDDSTLYLHAVSMSLGTSFRVQNPSYLPHTGLTCGSLSNGRGCLDLSGGLIQVSRGAVGSSTGGGFAKRYTYDRCAVRNPPPYFPTTGRFTDNRYLELDPVGFNPDKYFRSLVPNTP